MLHKVHHTLLMSYTLVRPTMSSDTIPLIVTCVCIDNIEFVKLNDLKPSHLLISIDIL